MKWYVEKHYKPEVWDDELNKTISAKIEYAHAYKSRKPKKSDNPNVEMVEVDVPPNEYCAPGKDEKDNFQWVYDKQLFLNKEVRPKRNKAMQKPLALIDQYRNETDMLKEGIITKRAVSDVQYKDAQKYLQALKDWPDNADIEVEGYNEPEIPDSLKGLI